MKNNAFIKGERVTWKKQGVWGHFEGEVIRVGKTHITVIFDKWMGENRTPFTRVIKWQNLDYPIHACFSS